ncbi:other/NAK protein kinase [Ephemerocybe angulata]|uniref:non-specific serine/threonine protein kinase n=1 Tax=Ephemerocybe angulata TaxID=980116 RepID=A0A8H6HW02_9AGAR|nr:other/NAK protein kinase [Tulosesus angulatus]
MATQQAYQAYAQSNKGTLVPGQTISVNKYTVQVERYLSQGGFAHVYLVRTPTPVYGTTHHVLKRIAVANEAMLSEVKKEVDVMRVLKGHPNIVHLIDAAWHRMPSAQYEVFILMEFCPGGGIIDMMNRRLRERLTEAEILQIFVDVCEGVAFMHNSRPPLLHRDLKVENILQSSPTSYKLCDFGSATTVSRPPTNTQEIRALEAEIGRHTTMQYRAPEMIDLYSKRPIDEKSDVWALGVLLYKLCYYTTPFEEHGSLAILNVQYRIPPYPAYSSQMNMLIASMLREHGTQRPSVYEVLNHVHYLRGTKSQFTYNVPTTQPLAPRQQPSQKSTSQSQQVSTSQPSNNYIPPFSNGPRNAHHTSSNNAPPMNAGAQAREKVLEAIAPMRRGRPANSTSGTSSPAKSTTPLPANNASMSSGKESNWLDNEEAAWKSMSAQAKAREKANALFDEAWKVTGAPKKEGDAPRQAATGFGDDFAEKLWRAPNPNSNSNAPTPTKSSPDPTSLLKPSSTLIKPLSHTGNDHAFRGNTGNKDAFEGLGLMTSMGKPAPTLAEARKLRTGLAIMSTQTHRGYNQVESQPKPQAFGGQTSARPTPSPRPSYLSPTGGSGFQPSSISPAHSPVPTGSSWQPPPRLSSAAPNSAQSATATDGTPIESRFPSLEEIDAQFSTTDARFPATSLYPSSTRLTDRESRFASQPKSASAASAPGKDEDRPPQLPPRPKPVTTTSDDSVRGSIHSAPVTKEPTTLESLQRRYDVQAAKSDWKASSYRPESNESSSNSLNTPSVLRPKRSSVTMKYAMESASSQSSSSKEPGSGGRIVPREDKYQRSPKPPPKDWLTGDDTDAESLSSIKQQNTRGSAILRETAAKRRSVIVQQEFKFPSPAMAQHDTTPLVRTQELPPSTAAASEESPTVSKFKNTFPDIDTEAANEVPANDGLTDNWSPIVAKHPSPPRLPPKVQEKLRSESLDSASSAESEDGPEDLGGLSSRSSRSPRKQTAGPGGNNGAAGSTRMKRKGRQSSVHDLVDLWGGGLGLKEKDEWKPPASPVEASTSKPFPSYGGSPASPEKKTPRARPTSLMPPSSSSSSGGLNNLNSRFGRGSVSPQRLSPIQRDTSGSSGYTPSMYESSREKERQQKEASKPVTSPTSASSTTRSRPQSMFLFPAKQQVSEPLSSSASTNFSPLPSPNPTTEEDNKPRAGAPVRRTSISNMVQRYEAIGGKVIQPQAVPSSPRLRKVSVKTTLPLLQSESSSSTSSLPLQRVKVFPTLPDRTGTSEKPAAAAPSAKDEFRPNRVVTTAGVGGGGGAEPTKAARTRTMSTGRALTSSKPVVDIPRTTTYSNNFDAPVSSSRNAAAAKTSPVEVRSRPMDFPSSSRGGGHAREPSSATASIAFPKPRNVTAEEPPARSSGDGDNVSSSPEKPYLGVGRLIDQWQRKSEETATKPGAGASAAAVAKRVGLVNGSNR